MKEINHISMRSEVIAAVKIHILAFQAMTPCSLIDAYQRFSGTFCFLGRAITQAVSRWLPTAAAPVRNGAEHMGFMVDKVALG
jgi:hypothetical protein